MELQDHPIQANRTVSVCLVSPQITSDARMSYFALPLTSFSSTHASCVGQGDTVQIRSLPEPSICCDASKREMVVVRSAPTTAHVAGTAAKTHGDVVRLNYRLQAAGLCAVILACLARAVWLILLTISPNEMMNRLMATTQYDDGTFWRVIDPDPVIVAFGVAGLCVVVLGYVATPLLFVAPRRRKRIAPAWFHSRFQSTAATRQTAVSISYLPPCNCNRLTPCFVRVLGSRSPTSGSSVSSSCSKWKRACLWPSSRSSAESSPLMQR
jgi:hypothetical protein